MHYINDLHKSVIVGEKCIFNIFVHIMSILTKILVHNLSEYVMSSLSVKKRTILLKLIVNTRTFSNIVWYNGRRSSK